MLLVLVENTAMLFHYAECQHQHLFVPVHFYDVIYTMHLKNDYKSTVTIIQPSVNSERTECTNLLVLGSLIEDVYR